MASPLPSKYDLAIQALNTFDPATVYTEEQILAMRTLSTSKPVIGISLDFRDTGVVDGVRKLYYNIGKYNDYWNAVVDNGGHPFVLSFNDRLEEVVPLLDGLVIAGGRDIHPRFYNEEVNGSKVSDTDHRFYFNKALVEALSPSVPIFGICWGMQFLNVLGGGSLVQDIPDRALHANVIRKVSVAPGSWLHKVVGDEMAVRCLHHQIVKDLTKDYVITGWDDASHHPHSFESTVPGQFRVGVQSHPEIVESDQPESHNKKNKEILRQFINQAVQFRARRPVPPNL